MLVTPIHFSTTLIQRFEDDNLDLPISNSDSILLKSLLKDGYTYLVIRDTVGSEVIRVFYECDMLVVERGQDGTKPRTAPRGACVRFEMVPAIVKDLICNYDCCTTGCQCTPVKLENTLLPVAKVGVPYTGTAVASGSLPMTLTASGMPSWMTVTIGANYLTFTGTPTGKGKFNIRVAATNCNGDGLDVAGGELVVE